jgi:serine/threonine-protein kinase
MGAPASPSIDDVIGDRYVLERPLGEGGMGTVYLARHRLTGRRVALKWVVANDAIMRERLLREARAMALLAHPNVVGVLDAGEQGQAVFLVMEYMNGQNLRAHVARRALPPEQAVRLLMPALCGVAAAHQAGVLHRDLKPENLFVCIDADGSAFDTKVLDFGVAKHIGSEDAGTSLTGTGVIVGTPKFMAPEQIAASPELDARTDIYALGVILYDLVTGRLPYAATQLKALLLEILRGDLPSPARFVPALPEALCAVIMKALASEPADRYPDVASFARALEPFGGGARFEAPRRAHVLDDISLPFDATLSARTDSGEVPVPAERRGLAPTTASGKRKPAAGSTLQLHAARTPQPKSPRRGATTERAPVPQTPAPAPPARYVATPTPEIPRRSPFGLAAVGVALLLMLLLGLIGVVRMHRAVETSEAKRAPSAAQLPVKIVQPLQPSAPPAPAASARAVPLMQPLQPLVIPVQTPQPPPRPVAAHEGHRARAQAAAATRPAPAAPAAQPATPGAVRGRSGVYRAEDF